MADDNIIKNQDNKPNDKLENPEKLHSRWDSNPEDFLVTTLEDALARQQMAKDKSAKTLKILRERYQEKKKLDKEKELKQDDAD